MKSDELERMKKTMYPLNYVATDKNTLNIHVLVRSLSRWTRKGRESAASRHPILELGQLVNRAIALNEVSLYAPSFRIALGMPNSLH